MSLALSVLAIPPHPVIFCFNWEWSPSLHSILERGEGPSQNQPSVLQAEFTPQQGALSAHAHTPAPDN